MIVVDVDGGFIVVFSLSKVESFFKVEIKKK
jgi:hypothetical protein